MDDPMHLLAGISLGIRFCPLASLSSLLNTFALWPSFLSFSLTKHKKHTENTTMSSHSSVTNLFHTSLSHPKLTLLPSCSSSSSFPNKNNDNNIINILHQPNKLLTGLWVLGAKDKRVCFDRDVRSKCSAISKPRSHEFTEVFQSGLPVIEWHGIVEDDIEGEAARRKKLSKANEIEERVESIKSMLGSMSDGEISISAYDTAWVALVEDVHCGSGFPQFPSSLHWIANNQLPDGSWGDREILSAHDRLLNTLACVIALKSWNIHPNKCEKGMAFFKENISKLENENPEHMPIGFEVAFPSLLEKARNLNLEVPDDSHALQEIYARRDLKLTRIPRDIMHTMPTTLLHSLEGMPASGLEWEKLLKLQSQDGSFLFSPSSTAFALMETKDDKCLKYLTKAVHRFNGGVPNVYPVDLFEHLWVADRLQRLGISRFFEAEIKDCVDYVHRYWTEKGICWARNSEVQDIDDTAMGFRLLRMHGQKVSADVFQYFKKGDEFFCFAGQSTQAVTGMYNLHRASQFLFPGEKILEDAKDFSSRFLRQKQASDQLLDKWIITKDLPGEVSYSLDVPWYASLPRVETRFYIEQYGGRNDVWIGKTLYRMSHVNNNEYLELAKLDYNSCQALHSIEWHNMQKWYTDCRLQEYGLSRKSLLMAYFLAAANIFEPERADERLAWAKTAALIQTITSYFDEEQTSYELRNAFVYAFKRNSNVNVPDYLITPRRTNISKTGHGLLRSLLATQRHLSLDTMIVHGRDISHHLRQAWEKWLLMWQEGDRPHHGEAELLIQTINIISARRPIDSLLSNPQYKRLLNITNRVCTRIRHHQKHKHKAHQNGSCNKKSTMTTTPEIEADMQELVQLVLQNSSLDGISTNIKQIFLMVAKTFYYANYCDIGTINFHIGKVLFETVD